MIRLLKIKGEEFKIKATCFHSTIKNFKPPVDQFGTIKSTPFKAELRLKIGVKIMLTYNVNTADGLTNGSRGELIGVIKNEQGQVTKLVVKFENPAHGQMYRDSNPDVSAKFPGGIIIDKVSFPFSLSNSKKSSVTGAKAIQFPLKLAFAATAHKIQGQTVKHPRKVVIDLRSVWNPAIAYVMLSRVESMDQILILEELDESKIYGNYLAMKELELMNKISVNVKSSQYNNLAVSCTRVCVLNCGSIRPQIEHIMTDKTMTISDAICLSETWIWSDEDTTRFALEGFTAHHNAVGRGKGVSVYYKECKFMPIENISDEKIQLTKLSGNNFDLIVAYKSPTGNDRTLQEHLQKLIEYNRSTLVCGDFNMCFIDNRNSRSTKFLLQKGFKQLVKEATHFDGGHIDHVYLRSEGLLATVELYSPYYTAKDHDALCISFLEGEE